VKGSWKYLQPPKKGESARIVLSNASFHSRYIYLRSLEICNGTGRYANGAGGSLPREALMIRIESD